MLTDAPDQSELAQRRAEMFGSPLRSTYNNAGPVVLYPCEECGVVVIDKDKHFGDHLRIENIDQRVVHHSHPHDHPEPGREP